MAGGRGDELREKQCQDRTSEGLTEDRKERQKNGKERKEVQKELMQWRTRKHQYSVGCLLQYEHSLKCWAEHRHGQTSHEPS